MNSSDLDNSNRWPKLTAQLFISVANDELCVKTSNWLPGIKLFLRMTPRMTLIASSHSRPTTLTSTKHLKQTNQTYINCIIHRERSQQYDGVLPFAVICMCDFIYKKIQFAYCCIVARFSMCMVV